MGSVEIGSSGAAMAKIAAMAAISFISTLHVFPEHSYFFPSLIRPCEADELAGTCWLANASRTFEKWYST